MFMWMGLGTVATDRPTILRPRPSSVGGVFLYGEGANGAGTFSPHLPRTLSERSGISRNLSQGTLMHLGVTGDVGDELLLELARLAGDEEASARGTKCSAAHSRGEAGEHITGLPRLIEEYFGQKTGKALRRWLGAPYQPDTPVPNDALQVGTPAISAFWEAAQTALLGAAPEAIFRRSGDLVRVRVLDREETEREGSIVRRAGTIEIARVTEGWLHLTFDRLGIQFFKETASGKRQLVPPSGLGILMVEPEDTRFPHLIGISTTPTLGRDDPGYDPESRLLLEFPLGLFPPVPQPPSQTEAREALDRIERPLREFPFAGPGSKSVMLSAILSGVVRGEMRTCPLHAFSAPMFGTGKTKLADIVSTIVTGAPANIITHAPDDGEMEKRLIAILLRGGSLVNIDNVSGPLTGDFLSAMLTAPTVSGRVLGESRVVELDTRTMVLATGNNLAPRGDLVRRVVVCRLDAGSEEPDKRQFDFDPKPRNRLPRSKDGSHRCRAHVFTYLGPHARAREHIKLPVVVRPQRITS